jgi:hypothetical protein
MLYEQERNYKAYRRSDRTRYVHRIGSIHRTILDSEQMVTIGMGKQVQSMGYDSLSSQTPW